MSYIEEAEQIKEIMENVKRCLIDRYRVTVLDDVRLPTNILVIDGRKVCVITQRMIIPSRNANEDILFYAYRLANWLAPRISKYFAFCGLDLKNNELRYIQHPGFREYDLYQMLSEIREAYLSTIGIGSPYSNIASAVDKLVEMQNSTEALKHDDLVKVMQDIMTIIARSTYVELDKFVKDVDTLLIPVSESA